MDVTKKVNLERNKNVKMLRKLILPVLLLLMDHVLPTRQSNGTGTPKIKVSRGVYYSTKDSVTRFYTAVGAVTYEFRMPDWSNLHPMIYDQDCPTDEIADGDASKSYTCPVFHYLHKIRDELAPLIQLANLQSLPSSQREDETFKVGRCPNLRRHFMSLKTTGDNMETYKRVLGNCVEGRIMTKTPVMDFNQALFKFPYAFMMSNFLDNYFKLLPAEGRTDLAVLLNAATSYNTLAFTQALAEAQRWTNALMDCKKQNIPLALIPSQSLAGSVGKLNELLSTQQLEPVINFQSFNNNDSAISQYYRAKLADCVVTDTNTLFVRILIPLKRISSSWKFLQVKSIPFLQTSTDQICYVEEFDSPKYYVTELFTKTYVDLEENSNGNICEYDRDEFCLVVPNNLQSIGSFRRTCASTVFAAENRRGVLNKFCPLVCEDVDFFNLPIFTHVAPDKFVVVGTRNDTLVVEIDSHVNVIPLGGDGAIEVTLPCKGVLMHGSKRFYAEEPCGQNYRVIRVEPVQWGELVGSHKDNNSFHLANLGLSSMSSKVKSAPAPTYPGNSDISG